MRALACSVLVSLLVIHTTIMAQPTPCDNGNSFINSDYTYPSILEPGYEAVVEWSCPNYYLLGGRVTIPRGVTLVISPNTTIYVDIFRNAGEVIVGGFNLDGGRIVAVGNREQPILFRNWDDGDLRNCDEPPSEVLINLSSVVFRPDRPGANPHPDTTKFIFCKFEHVPIAITAGVSGDNSRSAIGLFVIEDCEFYNCHRSFGSSFGGAWAPDNYVRIVRSKVVYNDPPCFGKMATDIGYAWFGFDLRANMGESPHRQPVFLISNCEFVNLGLEAALPEPFAGFHFIRLPASGANGARNAGQHNPNSRIDFCNMYNGSGLTMNGFEDDAGAGRDGPRLRNCYFHQADVALNPDASGYVMKCNQFQNNLIHTDIFADCDGSVGQDESLLLNDPGYAIEIVAGGLDQHLVFDPARSGELLAMDGINDGAADGMQDVDGSALDIGTFGGPLSDNEAYYVVLPIPSVEQRSLPNGLPVARYRVLGDYIVNHDISILPGTSLLFEPGTGIEFDGIPSTFEVSIQGTSQDSVHFGPSSNVGDWDGLSFRFVTLAMDNVYVEGALVGLSIFDSPIWDREGGVSVSVSNCEVGLDVTASNVIFRKRNGGLLSFSNNQVGANCRGNTPLNLIGALVSDNSHGGINVYDPGTNVTLVKCEVNQNGFGRSTIQGGIAFYNQAVGSLRCTEVSGNNGAGVYNRTGELNMSHFEMPAMFGGNDISNNLFPGQIYATSNNNVLLEDGMNRISSSDPTSPLIYAGNIDPDMNVSGNSWGYGPGQIDAIRNRLLPPENFVLDSYNSSWTLCDELPSYPTLSDCDENWLGAMSSFTTSQYASAASAFKNIFTANEGCKHAKQSVGMFVAAQQQSGSSYQAIRDTLLARAETAILADVEFSLLTSAAMCLGLAGEYGEAEAELNTLLQESSSVADSIGLQMSIVEMEYLAGETDYSSMLEELDELATLLEYGVVTKPTFSWSDASIMSASSSIHTISADAYTADGVPVSNVVIDYRILPTAAWIRDTLEQQSNDTTWEFTLALDSLGGGIEYRLLAIDTLGRVETWPGTEGYPNLNDTLTHFVSFEPRLTAPLTDTAYVYAPGVITEDITIGDGGVLNILPAPVELDSYVVSIDSAVGIVLEATEGTPKLIIGGTDSTVIRLDCASGGDRWDGIQSYGGWVEAKYAELYNVQSPLSTEKQESYPVVRFSDVDIVGFGSPLVLTYMNPGDADSSFLVDCTISDGDSAGMVILSGALDIEDVTIENCDGGGVVLFEPADQLLSRVRITNNGGYGLTTDPDLSGSARLSNCYIAFNGDTLPEIKVYSNSTIDVSDYAGNIVKDSTGVLFECAEVNDFDAELGSNSFVLADTTGKYFNVTSMSGPAYITGNSFYPESVNDSTFIDDFMKQDTVSKWVYSYLRAEDQMDDVIEDPNGSIDFELKAYVQNYLGSVTNDTITQVGFKYRLFPDSTNWTTFRQNTIETDSIYDWTVSVGDQGGLISYIWWAKDRHGRYITSPAGADTTTPDSGATHFLSFEIADTSIVADSVTIWAPTTLTHNINVGCLGRLVVKPWPGASDHTVTMAEGVAITVIGSCGQGDNRAKAWILGTESMPITFEAAVDTLEWQHIYLNDAILTASFTTFRTNLVAFEPGFLGNPEIKLDHCTFESSDGFFATMGTDVSTSYLRNCVFRDLGMSWDDGSFVVYGGDIEISGSWFYNNGGNGIVLYEPLETVVSGTNSIANDLTGLLSWGVTSSASITCSEFSYNGGDSTSEVLILDGVVDFSNDAGNVFADKAGILLEGSAMENFELVDGGNGFYLFDSTGQYVYTGDETDTLDVGGNLWYPWTPDTSIFQDYFEPDTSRFWDWDQPAVALASCGVGQGFSMPGGGPIALVRPDQQTYGTSSHGGGKVPLGQMTKSGPLSAKSNLASKSMASESKYQDALADQKGGRYAMAKEKFWQFVNQNLNDARTEAALSRLMVSARKTGQVSGLVEFFAGVERRSESPRVKRAAKFLKLDAMTLEGRHQEALNVYDEIISLPESRHDSLTAAIEATHLLFAQKDTKLATSHPENQSSSALEMYRRILRLIAQHQRSKNAAIDGTEDAEIPTSYALYQNYPNPFNPNTEIRFDLPEAIQAELKVFNILGQEVVTLVDDVRAAGAYRVLWDGKNAAGLTVASGVYIYQIKTPNFTDAKKMMLIR